MGNATTTDISEEKERERERDYDERPPIKEIYSIRIKRGQTLLMASL